MNSFKILKELVYLTIISVLVLINVFMLSKIEACNFYALQQSVEIKKLVEQVDLLQNQVNLHIVPIPSENVSNILVNENVWVTPFTSQTVFYVTGLIAVTLLIYYFGFYTTSSLNSSYQNITGTSEELTGAAHKVATSINELTTGGSDVITKSAHVFPRVINGLKDAVTSLTTSQRQVELFIDPTQVDISVLKSYLVDVFKIKPGLFLVSPGFDSNSLVLSNAEQTLVVTHKFVLPNALEAPLPPLGKCLMTDHSIFDYSPELYEQCEKLVRDNDVEAITDFLMDAFS